jgi:uncharacterized protein YdbL (DUF1318 family)
MAMKTRRARFGLLGLVPALVVGCVTINLYFPEAEVADLAQKIEDEVQEKAAESPAQDGSQTTPAEEAAPASGSRRSTGLFDTLLGVSPAYAQAVPEPEVTNPAIRKIIDSRAARLGDVNRYKAEGWIGENNRGLLETRSLDSISDLRARAEVQKVVRAENEDREQLYKEIAAVKDIDLSQLDKIRETYAETLRQNARPGEWIEMPDGSWKQK